MNNKDNNEETSKTKLYISLFKECCKESTAHAIPNIFRSRFLTLKVFWVLVFFAGLTGALYCIFIEEINHFRSYKNFLLKLFR